ncbi:A-kinase anchor protein 1, mitochondrial [Aplysia californica]|uniref:A-kinase anchor protein 1, mitochondrial n=1 Tax=Aplysia californica TaxID=6500 RepID=A0ABM1VPD3_APLCA|nr:A-kinase anchor protein 1, mitochondrial [Aplysia californica]
MKDYRLPLMVAVPAALAFLGVIWFLRRKNDDGKKRKPTKKELEQVEEKLLLEQITRGIEKEGITMTQRKIPDSVARDRGSSALGSGDAPDFREDGRKPERVESPTKSESIGVNKNTDFSLGVSGSKVSAGKQSDLAKVQREKVDEIVEAAIDSGLLEAKSKLGGSSLTGNNHHSTGGQKQLRETASSERCEESVSRQTSTKLATSSASTVASSQLVVGPQVCMKEPQAAELASAQEEEEEYASDAARFVSQARINLQGSPIAAKEDDSASKRHMSPISVKTLQCENKVPTTTTATACTNEPHATKNMGGTNKKPTSVESTLVSTTSVPASCTTVQRNNSATTPALSQGVNAPSVMPSKDFNEKQPAQTEESVEKDNSKRSDQSSSKPQQSGLTNLGSTKGDGDEKEESNIKQSSQLESLDSVWSITESSSNQSEIKPVTVDTAASSTQGSLVSSAMSTPDSAVSEQRLSGSTPSVKDMISLASSIDGRLRESSSQGAVSSQASSAGSASKEDSPTKSISPVCDNNSEGSNDSGRGYSDHETPGQTGEAAVQFDFNMPSELCGRFIGKQGKNINYLKQKTGANVSLTYNPFTPEYQICQVVGTQAEVDDALAMIRRKFPVNENPRLTMVPVNLTPAASEHPVLVPDVMQLSLPEGVSVEVYVSAVVDAGHVFIQQPTHRSFMSLEKLNYFLNTAYGQDPNIPPVPTPVECGVICVCQNDGAWYRAMITSLEDEAGECQVKFVDYGGYAQMPVSCLKQIRTDFMSLPFQAVECYVANITPLESEQYFSNEATMSLWEMTEYKLLQCQVVARTETGIPHVHLYQIDAENNSPVMINRALVNKQLVRWIEMCSDGEGQSCQSPE